MWCLMPCTKLRLYLPMISHYRYQTNHWTYHCHISQILWDIEVLLKQKVERSFVKSSTMYKVQLMLQQSLSWPSHSKLTFCSGILWGFILSNYKKKQFMLLFVHIMTTHHPCFTSPFVYTIGWHFIWLFTFSHILLIINPGTSCWFFIGWYISQHLHWCF